jgi:hypothetical protein
MGCLNSLRQPIFYSVQANYLAYKLINKKATQTTNSKSKNGVINFIQTFKLTFTNAKLAKLNLLV